MQIPKKLLTKLAKQEGLSLVKLQSALASGRVAAIGRSQPVVIGKEVRVKIGASGGQNLLPQAEFFLCVEGHQEKVKKILKYKKVPTGTIPLYASRDFNFTDFLRVLEDQLRAGADFVVLSAGVTATALPALQLRKTQLSPSAEVLTRWMARHKQDSPLFERFEEVVALLVSYQAAAYFATSLRPGNFSEVGDLAQLKELEALGRLVKICRQAGVSAVVEGPDLLPFNKIVEQITVIRDLTYGAPLILRGPRILESDSSTESASLGGVLAVFSGVAGLLADTVGLSSTQARQNFHQLRLAIEAGSTARKSIRK